MPDEVPVPHRAPRLAARRRVSAAVLALSRGQAPVLPKTAVARSDLLTALRRHRVAPLAHVRLREQDLALSCVLRPDRDAAVQFHFLVTACLARLDQQLDGLDWLVLKGPALSQLAHPVPGVRTYTDLDLLVAPHQLRPAIDALTAEGWTNVDRASSLRMDPPPGEMHWVSPLGLPLDLHWTLVNSPVTRRAIRVRTTDLLQRGRQVQLGHAQVRTLDAVDTVVHTCLHAALTGADRMLLLIDADRTARAVQDWPAVVSRAKEWGAGHAVALVLGRSRRLLGTPLPASLHERLGVGLGLRVVTGAVDLVQPVQRVRKEASLARVTARSCRADDWSTTTELSRRVGRGALHRTQDTAPAARTGDLPTDADRSAFLRAVRRAAGGTT